jgi:hypothetical protein
MEDSVRIWDRLQGASQELREAYHAALLRQAHRYWSGEIACITCAGLIQQLRGTDGAPAQAREQLLVWVESGLSDALASDRESSANCASRNGSARH